MGIVAGHNKHRLVALVAAAVFTSFTAAATTVPANDGDWWRRPPPRTPRKIVVGGNAQWQFGNNYASWACNNTPIYQFDTLVFKYPAPNVKRGVFPHSVYLLPNYESYTKCDLSRATKMAEPTQGRGNGFEFKLQAPVPHYFACGERNGFHCLNGTMKFIVLPWMTFWQ